MWLFSTKAWITIHFGKNPKNGGSPPSESKFRRKRILISELKLANEKSWLMWKIPNEWKSKTITLDKKE